MIKPIGYKLRLESKIQKKSSLKSNEIKLSDLDRKIAQIEEFLDDSDNSDGSDENESIGEEDSNIKVEKYDEIIVEKDSKGNIIRMISTNLNDEDFITPLPSNLLPLPQKLKNFSSSTDMNSHSNSGSNRRIRFSDETINSEVNYSKKQRIEKPIVTTKSDVIQYKESYEPKSQNRIPFWCRTCQWEGKDLVDFNQHKNSIDHKSAVEIDRKASYCRICKKQFTSPEQYKEHAKGSAHNEKQNRMKFNRQRNINYA